VPVLVAPARQQQQRADGLRKANEVRAARARLKRDLKSGAVAIDDVLRSPPPFVATMPVADAIACLRKFGPWRVGRVFAISGVPRGRRFEELTAHQRSALAASVTHLTHD
jgi:hypothetical protein